MEMVKLKPLMYLKMTTMDFIAINAKITLDFITIDAKITVDFIMLYDMINRAFC